MFSLFKKSAKHLVLALCLGASLSGASLEPAAAAPVAGLTTAAQAQTETGLEQARWHHRRYYVVRRYYRPVYRPFYVPACRRVVGWHMTRFGMVFGPYNRCYRRW